MGFWRWLLAIPEEPCANCGMIPGTVVSNSGIKFSNAIFTNIQSTYTIRGEGGSILLNKEGITFNKDKIVTLNEIHDVGHNDT
jgi:hypothetical protein